MKRCCIGVEAVWALRGGGERSGRDLPFTGNCNRIHYFIELLSCKLDLNVISSDKNKVG